MNKKFIINYLLPWSTLIILWFIIVAKSRQKMTADFVRRDTARLRTLEQKNKKLENSLSSCEVGLENANGEIAKLRMELQSSNSSRERETKAAGDEISSLKMLVNDMESKVSTLQSQSSKDKLALDQAEQKIKAQRIRDEQLCKDLATTKTVMNEKTKELDEAHQKLGTVALHSEELKRKNQILDRSLKMKEEELKESSHSLGQSKARELVLSKEMDKLRLNSENSINDLLTSLSSQTDTLEDRKDRIGYLQQVLEGFKTQHEIMEQKLLEAQACLDRERTMNEGLRAEKSDLETELMNQEMKFAEGLEKAKANSSNRMIELQEEFDYQRHRNAQRSNELKQILGEGFFASILTLIQAFPIHSHVKLH